MYQTALNFNLWKGFSDRFECTFMTIGGDAFYLNAKSDQIVQIFLNLLKMFSVRKTNQLGISIIMILITDHAEVLKVGGIHAQVDLATFTDFNFR